MFAIRYFAKRFFPGRYFPPISSALNGGRYTADITATAAYTATITSI